MLNSNKRQVWVKFKRSAGKAVTSGSTRLGGQAELYPEPALGLGRVLPELSRARQIQVPGWLRIDS